MIDKAIRSLLVNHAEVSAIVGTKVHMLHLPQGESLPAVSFSRISTGERVLPHNGPGNVADARFQISCWADSPLGAKNLAAAVRHAIHGFRGDVGGEVVFKSEVVNEVDLFDLERRVYHIPVDVMLRYRES